MPRLRLLFLALCLSLVSVSPAEEPKPAADKPPSEKTVEQLAESVRKSVVVILYTGRDGKQQGLGTGFVIGADGLIATNLHVIGEARPVAVRLADGSRHEVTEIHATERAADLALIRIDAKNLTPLELADSDKLKQGQAVVAMGNPQGLQHSVVSGVVSGRRDIDGQSMIQLAIPIEQGNSGGPLLDLQGRVHGILTLKSLLTENLGFATPINALKPLLKKPNPIPMAHWLTIGALDPNEWKPLFGARWSQRAGRLQVEGAGSGFGGRSLCLSSKAVPPVPFEIAVTVHLDDEAGAAGLAFHADGGNVHYGFYPTGGKLRLTRFDGPDVLSWAILAEETSPHYHPGDWNTLKVRVEKDKLLCYVNDQLAIESNDKGLTKGKVGLAKFRDTRAAFKNFQVAEKVNGNGVSPEIVGRVTKKVEGIAPQGATDPKLVDALSPDAPASLTVLRERARLLEQQAAQLRRLASAVHQKRVQTELVKLLQSKEDDIDLLRAALLLALLDNDEVDVEAYHKEVDRMARDVTAGLAKDADEKARLAALNDYLFKKRGFHGSRNDYYHRSNSYLNEVIDDREGLPITLSVLYVELARRVGLKVVGVALPGHFVVKHVPVKGEEELIDVFEGGQPMSHEEAEKRVALTGQPFREEMLAAAGKRAIVVRMLHNLLGLADRDHDGDAMLRYLDVIVALTPDAAEERWTRAVLRYQARQRDGAKEDVEWLLERGPEGIDRDRVMELRKLLTRPER
jgi:serine protease Do